MENVIQSISAALWGLFGHHKVGGTCHSASFRLGACALVLGLGSLLSAQTAFSGETQPSSVASPLTPGSVINVVATTGMVADVVREVGGKRVNLITLLKAGVDPHLYKLTRVDLRTLLKSDVIFYNGLVLEGKMIDSLNRIQQSGKPVVALAESLDAKSLLELEGFKGHVDPHVWMDVGRWMNTVGRVTETLSQLLPEHHGEFQSRAQYYTEKLSQLDQTVRAAIASIPAANRVLVTAHDAFGYFGDAYGIEVIGIQGVSTESEAGLRRIEDLVSLLVERRIPTVFVESSVSERNVKALIAGAEAQGHRVTIGGVLYSDATGKMGTWEGTYPGMLEHNASVIAKALGGDALISSLQDYKEYPRLSSQSGHQTAGHKE